MTRAGGILLAASAALALSGCVAAAIPLAAGTAMAKSKGTAPRDRTPAPHPSVRQPVFAGESGAQTSILGNSALDPTLKPMGPVLEPSPTPAPPPAAPAFVAPRREPVLAPLSTPAPPPAPTPAAAIASPPPRPAPAAASANGGFADFTRYALEHATDAPGEARLSLLVDPATLTAAPQRLGCGSKAPAVAIDLDPGGETFDPADPPAPAPGLAEALAQLRGAGVVIFWKSKLGLGKADQVYTVLRAVGLDPDRTDRLLLARDARDTKERRMIAAARDWCFVAIAGDRKGDFLEALDYLRDPDGPIAAAVKPLYGEGWFLTPTPIG